MDGLTIRDAAASDMEAAASLYAHHVRHGLATFEEEPPDAAEMTKRLAATRAGSFPWLVAEAGGTIVGYAYAGPYRARSAYRFTVEDSIYLRPDAMGRGIGSVLLESLIVRCTAAGARQVIAVIGDSGNAASIALHRRFGFAHAGLLKSAGFKFGRWVDVVLMQRPRGAATAICHDGQNGL